MYTVIIGKCIGRCPEIWVAPEDYELQGEQGRFETREQAEQFIADNWGEYPVVC